MKKNLLWLFAATLSLCMSISLTSCGGDDEKDEPAPGPETVTKKITKTDTKIEISDIQGIDIGEMIKLLKPELDIPISGDKFSATTTWTFTYDASGRISSMEGNLNYMILKLPIGKATYQYKGNSIIINYEGASFDTGKMSLTTIAGKHEIVLLNGLIQQENDIVAESQGKTEVLSYSYDANGRMTQAIRKGGAGETITYARNDDGCLTSVTKVPDEFNTTFSFTYDNATYGNMSLAACDFPHGLMEIQTYVMPSAALLPLQVGGLYGKTSPKMIRAMRANLWIESLDAPATLSLNAQTERNADNEIKAAKITGQVNVAEGGVSANLSLDCKFTWN